MISEEALKTSEIEGEYLNRESLQSSIRKQFGLQTEARKIPASEQEVAEMMVDLYENFDSPLSHETLFRWHKMLLSSRKMIQEIGRYRSDKGTIQILSGSVQKPNVHFEAPPSESLPNEMERYLRWFQE